MNELAVGALPISIGESIDVIEAFLAGRCIRTREAYRSDLEDFAKRAGASSIDAAASALLAHGHGSANHLALKYRIALTEAGLAPASINRRLAALRSLVKLARTLGLVPWSLEVTNVNSQPYRDTAGPGLPFMRKLLALAESRQDAKGIRDTAILHLLCDLGLRRGEVVAIDLSDLDLPAGTVGVVGKGKLQKQKLTLPQPTAKALERWIEYRGLEPGPLFWNHDRAGKHGRLTGQGVARMVRALSSKLGRQVSPHGLRHTAITVALDLTGGDLRRVQRFSRHANIQTLTIYDDSRRDFGGEVAALVANA